MPHSKISENRKLISWKDGLQICFFIILCLYFATCASFQPSAVLTSTHTSSNSKEVQLRKNIVQLAKKQVGSKYKYGGRSPKGFDCSGLTHYVMGNFDIQLTPVSRYQEREGKKIKVSEAQPGDLIFFRRTKNGDVYHVGLVISNSKEGVVMVHSSSKRGVVIDNVQKSSYWRTKIATARRFI